MDSQAAINEASDPPLVVRLVRRSEIARWRSLMQEHHYLGFQKIVGKALYYVATKGSQWVALLGWGSAALKCAARDQWIGWDRQLQWQRLNLIANNVRFLILPNWHRPNMASRVLAMNLKRLSHDWQLYHGNPIVLVETFVDGCRFRGTCYRAAGWQLLGKTRGYSKNNKGYWKNGQPKLVFVRSLVTDVTGYLRAAFLPPIRSHGKESIMFDINRLPLQGQGSLMELLQTLIDPRKPRGIRHPVATVVAISICAALSGARSFCAIAEWASGLSAEALTMLGSKRNQPPSEPTIRRILQKLDADRLDEQISQWLLKQHNLAQDAVAVDGKTLRGGHDGSKKAPHLLSAILHQKGVVIGQIEVQEKTNEIPKLPELLNSMPLEGSVVTADAMHTQNKTARFIVENKKADYLLIAKDNQPTLRQDIADLNLIDFPPGRNNLR